MKRARILCLPLVLVTACIGRDVSDVEPTQNKQLVKDIPVELNSKLDLLFVIDNSGSMADEQASLEQNFDRFINVLSTIEGLGLPDIHIGVVSTDLGTGPFGIAGCGGAGDDGVLQNTPRFAGCNPPAGQFISDVNDGAGGRTRNYTGDLSDTFGCIARLGTSGCGFEQPLESMRRALDGRHAQNAGFLREDALLGVVIITDEDDCSTKNTQMFDTSQTGIDDPLGPLSSHRCFEFGVACDPDTPRQTGAKLGCVPREDSQYMHGVAEYVDFLTDLKGDPTLVVVAGIIGPDDPVIVGADDQGNPGLEPSCQSGTANALPAVRIQSFLAGFDATRATAATICNSDLQDALTQIAELLKRNLGDPCLTGAVRLPLECVVSEVRNGAETLMDECENPNDPDDPATNTHPCFLIVEKPDVCKAPAAPTNLALNLHYGTENAPFGTRAQVRCVTD